jgi:twitching motility protein PilJ
MAGITPQQTPPRRREAALGQRVAAWMEKLGARDPDTLPILKNIPAERRMPTLVTALLASLLLAVLLFVLYAFLVARQTGRVEEGTQLQMLSQRIAKGVQQAALGNKAAFAQIKQSRDAFDAGLKYLGGDPTNPSQSDGPLGDLLRTWQGSSKGIATLLAQEAALVDIGQAIHQINVRNTEVHDLTEQLAALLPGAGKTAAYANQQALWTQRMAKNANALVAGDVIDPETAYQLGKDTKTFRDVLDGMLNGSEELGLPAIAETQARDKLMELRETFASYEGQVNTLLTNMAHLVGAKRASRTIFEDSEKLLAQSRQVTDAAGGGATWIILALAVLAVLATVASLVLLVLGNAAENRKRAEEAARANQKNQDAILRLLNEMGDLAEGNLAVRATVTEDITGAIADSVNFAIEELRMLVENIHRASDQVTTASDEAKRISADMQETARRQANEIAETSSAVNQMTVSIGQVSKNAAESTQVAQQSLESAQRGGESVRDAITGMNTIREQIQETSKRIKRLGESSQEIGEIVDLITGITEQTNVLALNAAIQAAAAGEAGRGFTVVAEEVQRLAERSGQATRRIGALVKTIQSDTQDAVHAMELSTQGVVAGTNLSDTAGQALQDIESVTERLAKLIQNISNTTRAQAEMANRVSSNMRQILQETRLNSESAEKSALSIGELAELSEELKMSVAGFKL